MPRHKSASGKRRRVSAAQPVAKPATKTDDDPFLAIIMRVHLPRLEAQGFLDALVLVGHGMEEQGRDDAGAVLTLAQAARERLTLIDDGWIDLLQAARAG